MEDMIATTLHDVNAWHSTCYLPKDVQPGTEVGHDARVTDHYGAHATPVGRRVHAETMAEEYGVWVEVPYTVVGEYTEVSSYWTRSNFERIAEDYPDYVLTIGRSSHDGQALWVRIGDDLPETLHDWVFGQQDYPIYDESHASDVEMRIEQDNWQDWGRDEFRREMVNVAPMVSDYFANLDDEALDEIAAEGREDGLYGQWVCETSEYGYWTDLTEWARTAVTVHLRTALANLN